MRRNLALQRWAWALAADGIRGVFREVSARLISAFPIDPFTSKAHTIP